MNKVMENNIGLRCPIHGELRYLYSSCTKYGECDYIFTCPKCNITLTGNDWYRVMKAFEQSKVLDQYKVAGKPKILPKEECTGFKELWRVYEYSRELAILVIKLIDGDYYTIRLIRNE